LTNFIREGFIFN